MQIKKYYPLIKIGFLSTFLVLLLRLSGILQLIELDCYDLFFRLKLNEKPEERIVLVAIEHEDVNFAKIYPFSDQIYADFFAQVKAQNPRVIGWNIIRDVPVPPGTEELSAILETTPNLIGVTKITNPEKFEPLPILKERNQYGDISGVNDPDGVVRKVYLYPIQNPQEKPEESSIPYLGLKLAYAYLAQEGIEDENSTINHSWLQLGKAHFPHFKGFDGGYVRDPAYGYQVLLNWRKPIHGFKEVSFFDVIEGNIPPNLFTDKIVLVGASSASNDFHVVPFQTRFGETLRGIDIISQATSQFISAALEGRPLMRVLPEEGEWLIIAICSFFVPVLFKDYKRYSHRFLIRILLVAIGIEWTILSVSLIAFNFSWWLPVIPAILGLFLSTIFLVIYLPINDLIESRKNWQQIAEQRASQLAAQESYVSLGKFAEAISIGLNNPLIKILNKTNSAHQKIEENIFLISDEQLGIQNKENLLQKIQENLEDIESEVTEIAQQCTKIDELIKETIPHITKKEECSWGDLNKILDKSWQWVYYKKQKKFPLEVEYKRNYEKFLPTIPTIFSSEIAFRYLLDNAYNAVYKKSQIINNQNYLPTIEVTTKNNPDCLEVEIFNNG